MAKTIPDQLTKEEIDKIMLEVSKEKNNERRHYYSLIFNLLRCTGRRLGEFYGVEKQIAKGKKEFTDEKGKKHIHTIFKKTYQWEYGVQVKDIEPNTNKINIYVLKKKKRIKKPAKISTELMAQVNDFILTYHLKPNDYLFRGNKSSRSYTQVQLAFKHYVKVAGINKPNASIHSLRHYFITHLRKKGWSYEDIAKVTGHASPISIVSYDNTTLADVENKLDEDLKDI